MKKLRIVSGIAVVLLLDTVTASAAANAGTITVTRNNNSTPCTGSIDIYNGYGNAGITLYPTIGSYGICNLCVKENSNSINLLEGFSKSVISTEIYQNSNAGVGWPSIDAKTEYGIVVNGSRKKTSDYTLSCPKKTTGSGISAGANRTVKVSDGKNHPYAKTTITVKG